jgi:hypothetical protein
VAIQSTDCNANGTPDWRELPLADIDRDGTLDACEIAAGARDCNSDGIPDADQIRTSRERVLEGAFPTAGMSRRFAFSGVRDATAGSTVEVEVYAQGDLGAGAAAGEFVRVSVGGTMIEVSGGKCGATATGTVSAEAFNEAIIRNQGGALRAEVESGAGVDSLCGDFFRITLRYQSGDLTDCNLNGEPDGCDLASGAASDCNGNGVLDTCDVGAGPTTDVGSGSVCDGQTQPFGVPASRRAVLGTAVTMRVTASGDTDRGAALGEFVEVRAGSATVMHQGVACFQSGTYEVTLSAAEFNGLIDADGSIPLTITAGYDTECNQCQASAEVSFTYVGVDPANDCNVNGIPDACDISGGVSQDADGNGVPDECVTPDIDADDDGVPDTADACPNQPGAVACDGCPANECGTCGAPADFDVDGLADCVDVDDDNDGYEDSVDAFPTNASEWVDSDGDGTGNNADADDDGDGFDDAIDNCPQVANDQLDGDGDGIGNACDADNDNDGIDDATDNCPTTPNPSQSDCDGNGIGDVCDASSTSAGPDLVANGGFEAAEFDGCPNACYTSCGFTLYGWSHGPARTEDLYRNSDANSCFTTPVNPDGGQYLLALQGSGCCNCNVNGAVWQPITTEAGRTYTLRMQVYLDEFDAIRVSYGGQSAEFSAANPTDESWNEVSWTFNGIGTVDDLRIESVGAVSAPGCLEAENAFVDNVRVNRDALLLDCNGNGIQDLIDIASGAATDCNSNCVPDSCEPDVDADGIIDACDPCPGKPGAACGGCPANECGDCGAPADFDGDGIPDCVDADDDNDGAADAADAFPFDPFESVDSDADGVGNNADGDDDNDGVEDAFDNCATYPNPSQADCDGNGIGDECEIAGDASKDCNGNGLLDVCDILAYEQCILWGSCWPDPSICCDVSRADCDGDGILNSCEIADGAPDCNANGIPDACDIASFILEDCNENGIGDSCEKQVSVNLSSGVRTPLGIGHPQQWALEAVVPAVAGPYGAVNCDSGACVELSLRAKGDLSSALEYVQVDLPGFTYRAFNEVAPGYQVPDCIEAFSGCLIPIEVFNAAIAPDGTLRITLTPSAAVDPNHCGGDTWIEASISYVGASTADCNANGVLDSCEIAAGTLEDSNGNGLPDVCDDPVPVCPADFDGNQSVNGADLGMLLSEWDSASAAYDLNRDGVVNGADLGLLLGAWGGCAE